MLKPVSVTFRTPEASSSAEGFDADVSCTQNRPPFHLGQRIRLPSLLCSMRFSRNMIVSCWSHWRSTDHMAVSGGFDERRLPLRKGRRRRGRRGNPADLFIQARTGECFVQGGCGDEGHSEIDEGAGRSEGVSASSHHN